MADLLAADYRVEAFYFIAVCLVGVALLVALLAVVGSVAVHSVESLLNGRRAVAAISALGGPQDLFARAQRWEAGLVALPMAIGGALLGATILGPVSGDAFWWLVCTAVTIAVLAALVWVAIHAAVRLTRPWTLRAAAPANLRTE